MQNISHKITISILIHRRQIRSPILVALEWAMLPPMVFGGGFWLLEDICPIAPEQTPAAAGGQLGPEPAILLVQVHVDPGRQLRLGKEVGIQHVEMSPPQAHCEMQWKLSHLHFTVTQGFRMD